VAETFLACDAHIALGLFGDSVPKTTVAGFPLAHWAIWNAHVP
jgi:hypothetical protein